MDGEAPPAASTSPVVSAPASTTYNGQASGHPTGHPNGHGERAQIEPPQAPEVPVSSRIPGFFRLSAARRRELASAFAGSQACRVAALTAAPDMALLNALVENVVGALALPFGVATNFRVDGKDLLVPMVIEESSVVAAASFGARLCRDGGGFTTEVVEDLMIGQVQLTDLPEPGEAWTRLNEKRETIRALANRTLARLVSRGGGCREVQVRLLTDPRGGAPMVVVHILVDCCDAMGANLVNTTCEAIAPELAQMVGARAGLRILSNLADRRRFRASCRVPVRSLDGDRWTGERVRDGIVEAARFAELDPYRAATHNKGVMNGIDAVALATGNDWRAIEAGAHAYAARDGRYTSLSRWWTDEDGDLRGELTVPLQVGVVGGVTRLHPVAGFALDLLGGPSGPQLARVMTAAGLAQNLSAIRALSTDGIQEGHMRMHAANQGLASKLGP